MSRNTAVQASSPARRDVLNSPLRDRTSCLSGKPRLRAFHEWLAARATEPLPVLSPSERSHRDASAMAPQFPTQPLTATIEMAGDVTRSLTRPAEPASKEVPCEDARPVDTTVDISSVLPLDRMSPSIALPPPPDAVTTPASHATSSVRQNQFVEYIAMSKNERGLDEMQLRLAVDKLAPMSLSLVQTGTHSLEISVRQGSMHESMLAQISQRLSQRGIAVRLV